LRVKGRCKKQANGRRSDGAIGMAYGVTASSVLLSLGVPPTTASACVHAAETFTTGASGFAHWRLGNVDRKLLVRLAVPGMIGGAIGAYVLSELPGDTLRPFISAYLLLLGVFIVSLRHWRQLQAHGRARACRRPLTAPAQGPPSLRRPDPERHPMSGQGRGRKKALSVSRWPLDRPPDRRG
jgi:uncharacterized membrane protein YfcA